MFPELPGDGFGSAYELEKKKYLEENAEEIKRETIVDKYLDKLELREAAKAAKSRKDPEADAKRPKTVQSDASEPIKGTASSNSVETKAD